MTKGKNRESHKSAAHHLWLRRFRLTTSRKIRDDHVFSRFPVVAAKRSASAPNGYRVSGPHVFRCQQSCKSRRPPAASSTDTVLSSANTDFGIPTIDATCPHTIRFRRPRPHFRPCARFHIRSSFLACARFRTLTRLQGHLHLSVRSFTSHPFPASSAKRHRSSPCRARNH